jgi:hypothetical protein
MPVGVAGRIHHWATVHGQALSLPWRSLVRFSLFLKAPGWPVGGGAWVVVRIPGSAPEMQILISQTPCSQTRMAAQ